MTVGDDIAADIHLTEDQRAGFLEQWRLFELEQSMMEHVLPADQYQNLIDVHGYGGGDYSFVLTGHALAWADSHLKGDMGLVRLLFRPEPQGPSATRFNRRFLFVQFQNDDDAALFKLFWS